MNGDKPTRCKVVNQDDISYRPTPYPLKEGAFMLELCPPNEGYIFPSHHSANRAIHYAIQNLKDQSLPFDPNDYIIFDLMN